MPNRAGDKKRHPLHEAGFWREVFVQCPEPGRLRDMDWTTHRVDLVSLHSQHNSTRRRNEVGHAKHTRNSGMANSQVVLCGITLDARLVATRFDFDVYLPALVDTINDVAPQNYSVPDGVAYASSTEQASTPTPYADEVDRLPIKALGVSDGVAPPRTGRHLSLIHI